MDAEIIPLMRCCSFVVYKGGSIAHGREGGRDDDCVTETNDMKEEAHEMGGWVVRSGLGARSVPGIYLAGENAVKGDISLLGMFLNQFPVRPSVRRFAVTVMEAGPSSREKQLTP